MPAFLGVGDPNGRRYESAPRFLGGEFGTLVFLPGLVDGEQTLGGLGWERTGWLEQFWSRSYRNAIVQPSRPLGLAVLDYSMGLIIGARGASLFGSVCVGEVGQQKL